MTSFERDRTLSHLDTQLEYKVHTYIGGMGGWVGGWIGGWVGVCMYAALHAYTVEPLLKDTSEIHVHVHVGTPL